VRIREGDTGTGRVIRGRGDYTGASRGVRMTFPLRGARAGDATPNADASRRSQAASRSTFSRCPRRLLHRCDTHSLALSCEFLLTLLQARFRMRVFHPLLPRVECGWVCARGGRFHKNAARIRARIGDARFLFHATASFHQLAFPGKRRKVRCVEFQDESESAIVGAAIVARSLKVARCSPIR